MFKVQKPFYGGNFQNKQLTNSLYSIMHYFATTFLQHFHCSWSCTFKANAIHCEEVLKLALMITNYCDHSA